MDANARHRGGVVVTGSSTGIGHATALYLDSLGYRVFAGIRKQADADRLVSEASGPITPVPIEVTDPASVDAAATTVADAVGERGLAGLVNNAGIAVAAPLEILPIDALRHQLEVNVVGQVAVTQAFLPLLRRARGRIVNIGSVSGLVALPMVGAYAASKFALEAVTDSMRQELHRSGIRVAIVEPATTATPIWEKSAVAADATLDSIPAEQRELYAEMITAARAVTEHRARHAVPAERVAVCVARALTARRPRARYLIGREPRMRVMLSRILPERVFDALVRRALHI